MLTVNQVSKSFGAETILDRVSFVVNPGVRMGLIGPNGCGKTTLLNIVSGKEQPDSGHIVLEASVTLGYLQQGLPSPPGHTVYDEVRSGIAGWKSAHKELEALASRMAEADGDTLHRVMNAYNRALARFEALGGYNIEHRAEMLLAHLGLASVDPQTPLNLLSGGQQTRVGLARLLLAAPTLLLLDEPTNHLDIDALEWLETFLIGYPGAVLIVSHDRVFLDHTATSIIELDASTHQITEYAGNYSAYAETKARATEKQWAAWKDQQAEIRRLRQDIHRTKMHARSVEVTTTPREPGPRRLAKKVARKAKSREKKLERYLESGERVEKPDRSWVLKLEFGEMPRGGQQVVSLNGVGHAFDAQGWLFRGTDLVLTHGERVVLLGPNGCGKSTLLRIIVGDLEPAEGSIRIGANVRLGYMPQKQETLDPDATPLSTILCAASMSETDARSFLHFFLFSGDEVFTPISKLSYGERARLLLAKLVIGGANFLVLDEPINHLDISSRERFEAALDAFPGSVLVVVHDRIFIDRFVTGIWSVENGTIRNYIDRAERRRLREPTLTT